MMNVPFRGLELYGATQAEQIKADSTGGLAYPLNSVVKVVYPRRKSKVTPGKEFSALDLYWYENEFRPDPERLYKWSSTHGGKIPKTGCYIKGSKGDIIVLAGKGHEDYQILKDNVHIHFDEREIVKDALKSRKDT